MKVVLDSVVFVRSLINPFSICGKAVFANSHKYTLVMSQPIIEEVFSVLSRPELTKRFSSLEGVDLSKLLRIIVDHAVIVDLPAYETISRDPKDDKFLVTAQVAGADYLVSHDKDLLDMVEYQGTKIIDCFQFFEIVK